MPKWLISYQSSYKHQNHHIHNENKLSCILLFFIFFVEEPDPDYIYDITKGTKMGICFCFSNTRRWYLDFLFCFGGWAVAFANNLLKKLLAMKYGLLRGRMCYSECFKIKNCFFLHEVFMLFFLKNKELRK